MKVKLQKQNVKVVNNNAKGNDVFVDFEYERIEENLIKTELDVSVGNSKETRMKLVFEYDLYLNDGEQKYKDSIIVKQSIEYIGMQILSIVSELDSCIQEENLEITKEVMIDYEDELQFFS